MDKSKLVLPITILLGCIILGGFFYASQLSKQKSIEKQQQIELQAKVEADQVKADRNRAVLQAKEKQDKKEYVAKRKIECYAIYEKEREKYNNVENFGYVETCSAGSDLFCQDDSCEIIYKNNEWRENDPNSCKPEDFFTDEKNCTIQKYFRKYF